MCQPRDPLPDPGIPGLPPASDLPPDFADILPPDPLDDEDIEPAARADDPETSHEAAQQLDRDEMRRLRAAILYHLLDSEPQPDTDIVAWVRGDHGVRKLNGTQFAPEGIRGRRKELCRRGLVREAGRLPRRIIWGATPAAEIQASRLENALRVLQHGIPAVLRALVAREASAARTANALLAAGVQPWANPYPNRPPVVAEPYVCVMDYPNQ